ncbi:MAG: MFS transporter [Gemmatimonadota bacterium]|nr:MFS transporter [Gemmatimonadota bacterium]
MPPLRLSTGRGRRGADPGVTPGTWAPLGSRLFRGLWIANLVSSVGTWVHQVAAAWLMTELAPTPVLVALVQAASGLGMFLVVLPAGVLADVLDRRRVLLFAQAWLLLTAASLGALALGGRISPGGLLLFTFLMGVGGALMQPAWRAVLPEVVPPAQLPSAIVLEGLGVNAARALGPALGGALVAAAGPGAAFLLNSVTYLGILAVVLRWRRDVPADGLPAERFLGALRGGFRYVRHSPQMAAVLVRMGLFITAGSALWALLPLVARQELGFSAAGYGAILSAFGAGAVGGALTLGGIRRRLPFDRIAGVATVLFGLALAALGLVRVPAVFLALCFVAGAAWLHLLTTFNTAAQTVLPGWVRARGMSLYVLVFFAGTTAGSILWGAVADRIGLSATLVAAGLAVLAGTPARLRFRIRDTAGLNLASTRHWPAPQLAEPVEPEEGPVMVSVEYPVDPERRTEFEAAMRDLHRRRRRSGAYYWELFVDSADPDRHIEVFLVDSWAEHLRQHERVTELDRQAEERARACLRKGARPRVQHFLAARGWRSRFPAAGPPADRSRAPSS